MLGVPEGERQKIRERLDLGLHREPGQMDFTPEGWQAVMENGAYFYELAVDKRRHPADDMISRLTQVTVDRGDGVETGLDDGEIAGFVGLLGGAGAETVTKLVGNAVVLFARHREQWQKILDDSEKIPRAVDEILRILPPSQYQGRFSVADREFEGGTIPAGFPVLLITGAATRDPRAFERPDEFDVERPPGISIGFGHGVHAASAPRSHAWRAGSRSRRWPGAGGTGRSTIPASAGSTCRTSPATHTSRSAWRAEAEPRSPVLH